MDLPHIASRRAVLAGALGTGGISAATMLPAAAVDDIPTNPSSQFWLKVGAIVGDSVSAAHPKLIDVLTWSFGADTSISPFSTGSGPSKSKPRDFTFIARMGSHSPHLFKAAAIGTKFASATLYARKASGSFDYLVVTLENVYVTSYSTAPSDFDATPLDVVRLDPGEVTVSFKAQKPDGSASPAITTRFDFVTNS